MTFLGCEVRDDPTQTTNEVFLNALKVEGVPTSQLSKDTELIKSRLEEEEFVFAGGIGFAAHSRRLRSMPRSARARTTRWTCGSVTVSMEFTALKAAPVIS